MNVSQLSKNELCLLVMFRELGEEDRGEILGFVEGVTLANKKKPIN